MGFKTNIDKNSARKEAKYKETKERLAKLYDSVTFINLSMGATGVLGNSIAELLLWLETVVLDKKMASQVLKSIINICVRSSYYIFCCRNKEWTHPDFMIW